MFDQPTGTWRVPRSSGEDSTGGRILESGPCTFTLQFTSGNLLMNKTISKAAFWWSNREDPRIKDTIHFFELEDGWYFCDKLYCFYSISTKLSQIGQRWSCYHPETKQTRYLQVTNVCNLVNTSKLPFVAIEAELDVRVALDDNFDVDDIPKAKTVREWLEKTTRL